MLYGSFQRSLDSLVALLWTPSISFMSQSLNGDHTLDVWKDESLVEMYKHLVVYVLETAMNKTEHGVRLLDFVCQVFGKLEVVLESNNHIFF